MTLQFTQVLDQIPDREIGGIALTGIPKGPTKVIARKRGIGQRLAMVATALKGSLYNLFVFPGKSAEQDGHTIAFFSRERPLNRTSKMLDRRSAHNFYPNEIWELSVRIPAKNAYRLVPLGNS